VEVTHLLSFLKDKIGWEALARKVSVPLSGLKVVPYYGCTLQRPRNVAVELPGHFELMTHFLEALGATVLDFPAADLCCGSYQVLTNPRASKGATSKVLNCAERVGAEALALSCPLCEFNLSKKQSELLQEESITKTIPTFYFTQLLVIALGLNQESCRFELNEAASLALVKRNKYV
jgi:heterodisulfide reductase subunit B